MIDLDKIKILGNWVLLGTLKSTRYKLIEVPDSFTKASPMTMALKVGSLVPEMIKPGDYVIDNAHSRWKKAHKIVDSKTGTVCYIAPCFDIKARVFEGKVYPIGKTILVKRIMSENQSSDIIVSRDWGSENTQGLNVEVVSKGLTFKGKEFKYNNIEIGDRCKLVKWEQHMTEINVGGSYHLIVNEEDLEYKINEQ